MTKAILHIGSLLLGLLLPVNAAIAQPQRCGAVPRPAQLALEHERLIADWLAQYSTVGQRSVVTIPVVVHVVWNKTEENIPDVQILSQLEVLNKDFRALNTELPSIPAVFQDDVADVEFEFCLATKDPDGQPTTGITRTFTTNSVGIGGTSAIYHGASGGQDAWDPEKYLNIWVAKFAGGVGGVASFPGDGPADEDGVVINFKQFGTLNVEPPYHLGRTCTHEIGHYFNLEHVWGPSILSCCDEDDFVADTPNACETYLEACPVHPVVSCTGPDMFMNYLFYTDDACMGMFTKGQKDRMWAALNLFRPGLLESGNCATSAAPHRQESWALQLLGNPVHTDVLAFVTRFERTISCESRVYNGVGQLVAQKTVLSNGHWEMDLGPVPNGIYWLELGSETGNWVQKFVKN